MNTSRNLKHLAAGTAAAAVLAATAGTAALTLTTTTTAAGPPATVLRTLAHDTLRTTTSGLLTPAAHPVPRIRAGTPKNGWV